MSKIIWESESEQGVICQSHIVGIKSVIMGNHDYEMYDEDCKVYPLSEIEMEQILGQIDHDDFIMLEAAGTKLWLNKDQFTDAICNPDKCEIGGWNVHPLIFAELVKYIKAKRERKAAKKAARKAKKAMMKTPEGIKKLIEKEKLEHAETLEYLQSEHDFLIKNPSAMA